MRLNEEQLIDDLYQQQSLAKDAIRSMENLSKKYEEERDRAKIEAEQQLKVYIKKEAKIWDYKMEALKTVNDTLTKRVQGYEEQENLLMESEQKNEELHNEIATLKEDLERVRSERKAFKEENHRLMKKVIKIEETYKNR